jgi:hypothetical protein
MKRGKRNGESVLWKKQIPGMENSRFNSKEGTKDCWKLNI